MAASAVLAHLLGAFFRERDLDETVTQLCAAGIPAGRVWDSRRGSDHPQLVARGFYEQVTHAVAGTHPTPTLPFRYASVDAWIRSPAPRLGEHNREVLRELAGLSDDEIAALERDGVIANRPDGV